MWLNESKKCKYWYLSIEVYQTTFTRPANNTTVTSELFAHTLDWHGSTEMQKRPDCANINQC